MSDSDYIENCTYTFHPYECPINLVTCVGCAWDVSENLYRKSLNLVTDEETGLRKKILKNRNMKFSSEA